MISDRPLFFEWNIGSDGWATKCAVLVFIFANAVGAVLFDALAQVDVSPEFPFDWFPVDTPPCIPSALALHIPDPEDLLVQHASQNPLPEVLNRPQLVLADGLVVLNRLLNNDCFGEGLVVPLGVHGHSRPIEHLLLSKAKAVVHWVHWEGVVALFLLSGLEVAVRFSVHLRDLFFLVQGPSFRVEHLFGGFRPDCRCSEGDAPVLGLGRPVVAALITLAQGFVLVGSVFVLFYSVEHLSQTVQVLSFHYHVYVVGSVRALSVGVVLGHRLRIHGLAWPGCTCLIPG